MSYRRYPDRERALSQLDRHNSVPEPTEFQQKLAQDARAAMEAAGRTLRPMHDAMLQLAASAPVLLAQSAPAASKFIEALKHSARTA
ncbi:hypothetical protein ELQ39_15885 [Streptomyces sp. GB4-14]|uniref:hypothetical protein n=1 Tax=Streptomyces sp. GB4-14 TaxID=2498703 RepID=UPI001F5E796A|nr:hypothetical protein [Streptomyces sp. GB4-14]